jgi:hypothetical protein
MRLGKVSRLKSNQEGADENDTDDDDEIILIVTIHVVAVLSLMVALPLALPLALPFYIAIQFLEIDEPIQSNSLAATLAIRTSWATVSLLTI